MNVSANCDHERFNWQIQIIQIELKRSRILHQDEFDLLPLDFYNFSPGKYRWQIVQHLLGQFKVEAFAEKFARGGQRCNRIESVVKPDSEGRKWLRDHQLAQNIFSQRV